MKNFLAKYEGVNGKIYIHQFKSLNFMTATKEAITHGAKFSATEVDVTLVSIEILK